MEKTTSGTIEASETYAYHIHVGDVDVKAMIVAVGQNSEAISLFCTPRNNARLGWEADAEDQAKDLLEYIRRPFSTEEYKCIPLMARNCAGMKIHRSQRFAWRGTAPIGEPRHETVQMFEQICNTLQNLSVHPGKMRLQANIKPSRHSFHNRVSEQTLRNEVSRIIASSNQLEAKVSSIMRLLDRSSGH